MLVLYSGVADYMACCQLVLLSVVGCVADAASLRYCAGVVGGACCMLAHMFVVYGAADAASLRYCDGVVGCAVGGAL